MSATKPEIDNAGKLGTCNESSVPHVWHEICASWTPQSVSVDVTRELYLALKDVMMYPDSIPGEYELAAHAAIKIYEEKVKP